MVKYKACLNLHGGKQELGANYFKRFDLVVTWMAIHILLVLAILYHLSMRQINLVMAYTQEQIECEMDMMLPHGISIWHGHVKDYVLMLINNIYEQKHASKLFFQIIYLVSDEYVIVRGQVFFVAYVDDGFFFGPHPNLIDEAICFTFH